MDIAPVGTATWPLAALAALARPIGQPSMTVDLSPPAVEVDPDLGLIERVAGGDPESFAHLVDRHAERLARLCERLLGNPEEARDAVQEVLLKAYRNAGRYRPRGKVYTWLYRIAVNHCLNRLRRRKVVRFLSFGEMKPIAPESPDFDPPDSAPDPLRRLAARRRWQQTRRQIDSLPEGQRAVLVLARFEGLRYREIAEILDITEGAVESRLHRAMTRLRKSLPEKSNE